MKPNYGQGCLSHGDYVTTPSGTGRVVYVVMSPPDYTEPQVVSVLLDDYRLRLDYRGTMFLASAVTKIRDNASIF